MNKFETLIQELGEVLGVTLQAEKGFLCKLLLKDTIHVQLESDEENDRIIIASLIAELPPGKFREDALMTALKINFLDTSLGSFAYTDKPPTLVLQMYLPISTSAALLGALLQQFVEKAMTWKESIEQGTVTQLAQTGKSSLPSPLNFS